MPTYNLGHVKGADGKGIQSITKTGTSGLVDTYTITYTDGSTTTYTVTNGSGGADIATSWGNPVVDTKVPSEKLTKDTLDGKASNSHQHGNLSNDGKIGSTNGKIVVTGTGGVLQASDLKTINNNNLIGSGNIDIQGGGGVDIVTSWESTLSDEKVPSEKLTKNTIDTKVTGSKVTSWSGTVSDTNVPSEKLVKDSLDNKIAKSSTSGLVKNDGTIDTSTYLTELKVGTTSGKPVITGTDGALTAGSFGTTSGTFAEGDHTHSGYQATLVSGTNIKTVNGNDLLGSGDISVGVDAGSFGDLQSLITNASSGDTIILDKDYKNTGNESQIEINKPLTIIGNGHIIDADKKSRILYIPSTGNGCKINGLIFANGNSNNWGGAIFCNSSNTISDCSFTNNTANEGGAINCNSSNNTISDCSFNGNTATNNGGAIWCNSSYNSISDCSFNGNTATNGANIYDSSSSSLIIYNCHISTGLYNTFNYDDLNSKNLVTSWSSTVSDTNLASEKLIKDTIDGLSIPTKISDLTNDSDFIETSLTSGLIKNDGSIDTNTYVDTDDIANDLTTTTAGKVLDARQGKALKDHVDDLIGDAIDYINM